MAAISPFYLRIDTGLPVVLRPMDSADRGLVEEGFARLSPQSRQARFHRAVARLTPDDLDAALRGPDADHVAIGALSVADTAIIPAGLARYSRLHGGSRIAELGITIIDAYQGHGLGRYLIATLLRAAVGQNITHIFAHVRRENVAMRHLLMDLGAEIEPYDWAEAALSVPVHADPALYPDTHAGAALREVAARQRRIGSARYAQIDPQPAQFGALGKGQVPAMAARDIKCD